ncbi:MAG: histidinol-phosphate transaminase [Woeseiaceae bacterium]
MTLKTNRRSLLLGAAGVAVSAAACQPRLTSKVAEAKGAFAMPGQSLHIGPKPGFARLHSNENPYGPARSALDLMDYAARKGAYYADGGAKPLMDMIAERHSLNANQVTISTGSAEALSAIALVFGRQGPIVAPRLFFDATPMYAKRLGLAEIIRAPMTETLDMDLAALEAMVTPATGMVQICNPNNPTGVLAEPVVLKAAVKRMARLTTVVVDEAYMELTDQPDTNSCVDLVREGHNVIVSRTFSKLYGMAGIRVGYVISSEEAAKRIAGANMTWMSGLGYAAAIGCYNDTTFIERSRRKILQGREMVNETLASLDMTALPSQTNFVYFKSGQSANALQAALAERQVLIRGQYMDYADWSRVSMGRLEDVAKFCQGLREVVGA